ncbi:MAG: hypothetical protein ACR2LR_05300 [Hassallia sp.]
MAKVGVGGYLGQMLREATKRSIGDSLLSKSALTGMGNLIYNLR